MRRTWISLLVVILTCGLCESSLAQNVATKIAKRIEVPSSAIRLAVDTKPFTKLSDLRNSVSTSNTRNNINRLRATRPIKPVVRASRMRNMPEVNNNFPKTKSTPAQTKARFQKTWDNYSSPQKTKVTYNSRNDISQSRNVDDLRRFNSINRIAGPRPSFHNKKNIAPEGWLKKQTRQKGGVEYEDPNNKHNSIRQMPGNPEATYASQRIPYTKFKKNGTFYDVNGKPLKNGDLPEAHIPSVKFNINKMPKFD